MVLTLRAAGCVFAEEEAELLLAAAVTPEELTTAICRRVAGEPLELVLGWAEFHGRRIAVTPGVFVPRRRTELLAEVALSLLADRTDESVVVEMCCGVAAVASVVAQAADIHVWAADIDPVAVACARENLGDRGTAVQGDLFQALPDDLRGRIDLLVANAPYVPTARIADMPREARDHEPLHTLDGGSDGLEVQRRLVAGAATWLAPGGTVVVESSRSQREGSMELLRRSGFRSSARYDSDRDATAVIGVLG